MEIKNEIIHFTNKLEKSVENTLICRNVMLNEFLNFLRNKKQDCKRQQRRINHEVEKRRLKDYKIAERRERKINRKENENPMT